MRKFRFRHTGDHNFEMDKDRVPTTRLEITVDSRITVKEVEKLTRQLQPEKSAAHLYYV